MVPKFAVLVFISLLLLVNAFNSIKSFGRTIAPRTSTLMMADVEITFPNNRKAKVPSGSALKDGKSKLLVDFRD